MHKDIETWRSAKVTQYERRVILRDLGFFATADLRRPSHARCRRIA